MADIQTQIMDAVRAHDTIIIHRHVNPDPDAFGSQLGLAEILREAYPTKHIFAVGEPEARLAWIGVPDQIDDAVYDGALVIVIDTANTERIADSRYDQGALLIKIDHHPNREPFGDLQLVNTHASSSSEIVADLVRATPDLNLSQASAAKLYAGIIGDTGRFLFDLTTPHTHEVAAELMATGIDAPALGRQEDELSPRGARLIGYALSNVTVSPNGAGSLLITQDLIAQFGLAPGEAQMVVGFIGKLDTIKSWVVFTERDDGRFRVELRSKQAPIQPLAIAHGGGGHPLASGAIADDKEEMQAIVQELDDLVKTV
ncbi:DHH family phosphoesterase [Lacticaseibacillus mingshuiensis]|uniref:Bifunctional oligoribonuclease/PAP phosphatase NrnA n=1 Tax=Lacticaseibacillus mingshuiensis TaxID=2799574 RepID=A0ABW4CFW1_9LACO|nr:bifunctional oligoribonuclease/PAP phosphatase NrnA [Lacticaseibacillus mingshuiensis]